MLYCDRCSSSTPVWVQSTRTGGEYYCPQCFSEYNIRSGLLEYLFKPCPIFMGTAGQVSMDQSPGVRYFGVELEIARHVDKNPRISSAVRTMCAPEMGHVWYAKRDGSVDGEFVSQPLTMEAWKEHLPKLTKSLKVLGKRGWRSYHGSRTCGIHVHVNKTSFEGYGHYYRVARFLNSVRNRNFTLTFSQRKPEHLLQWANFMSPRGIKSDAQSFRMGRASQNGRYQTLALTAHTVEFRFFRGNLKSSAIMRNVQLLDAVIEFTRPMTRSLAQANSLSAFWKYVRGMSTKYPELVEFMDKEMYGRQTRRDHNAA